MKQVNLDLAQDGANRALQLNELEELRMNVYESSKQYKAQMKAFHDKYISRKTFEPN